VTASIHLTYPAVLVAVFARQLCVPIPALVFLMAAGALSAQGQMQTSIIVFLAVAACLAADGIWFWLGRRWGSQVLRLLCRFTSDPRRCAQNANEKFRRYGPPVLCVAKFSPGPDFVTPPLIGAERGVARELPCPGYYRWASLVSLVRRTWIGFQSESERRP
jgi:membrane protein DedA with SNARE-associated domain